MPWPARPTLRCLRDDLADEWDDNTQRAALRDDPSRLPYFHKLSNAVVRHAAAIFTGAPDDDAKRESISGLTNPVWWKLKTSRNRGAVWIDADGQAWICASDLRREGEATDFYKAFSAAVKADGPEAFLPTEEDRRRLRFEQALDRFETWEQAVHTEAAASFHAALELGRAGFTIGDIAGTTDLCRIEVEVVVLPAEGIEAGDAGVAEVVVTATRLDWARPDLVAHAELLVLTAINPEEQSWDPGHAKDQFIFSFVCSETDLMVLREEVDPEALPGRSKPGVVAHWAHRERLTESYVDGHAVRGLCGIWFVPRQDPETRERCPTCDAVYRTLEDVD